MEGDLFITRRIQLNEKWEIHTKLLLQNAKERQKEKT
jgi:hypothetical protein